MDDERGVMVVDTVQGFECVMCGCGDVADWAQLAPMLVWVRCRDCHWDNMVVAS
jgi:hypothetical protein